jgi:peptidyl-prolyl cis-trans isomerase B (cyclophilin B)
MNRKAEVDAATVGLDFKKNRYQVRLETSEGMILLDLMPEKAPNHCRNLIGLAKIGFYNQGAFHRIIDGFMIQGGCPQKSGTSGPGYQIKAEFNDMPHDLGVLSMARTTDPNSAGSQFFICLGRHTHLDRAYTAFGKTADTESLQTVRKIGNVATDANDRPRKEVAIISVQVLEHPETK